MWGDELWEVWWKVSGESGAVAAASSPHRSFTFQEVAALLEEGVYDMKRFLEGGWVTALKYEDEVLEDLKERTGRKPDEVGDLKMTLDLNAAGYSCRS